MSHMFTASQTAELCCVCMAVGIIIGVIWMLHVGGGLFAPIKQDELE